jgi:hypothetical protein
MWDVVRGRRAEVTAGNLYEGTPLLSVDLDVSKPICEEDETGAKRLYLPTRLGNALVLATFEDSVWLVPVIGRRNFASPGRFEGMLAAVKGGRLPGWLALAPLPGSNEELLAVLFRPTVLDRRLLQRLRARLLAIMTPEARTMVCEGIYAIVRS